MNYNITQNNSKSIKNIGNINSFAIISDVHLRSPYSNNYKTLLTALKSINNCDAIFLLGDIFEFIFIEKIFFRLYWKQLFSELTQCQKRGIKVFFIEGNHDYGFEFFFPPKLKSAISYYGDLYVQAHHAVLGNLFFAHGDDIICSPTYLTWRSKIKSKNVQKIFKYIPGILMHIIFIAWAYLSRQNGKYKPLQEPFLKTCLTSFSNTYLSHPTTVFLGHLHINMHLTMPPHLFLCGPSWEDAPNILLVSKDGSIERRFLDGKKMPLSFQ